MTRVYPRNRRICFKTTRSDYAWLDMVVKQLGTTRSGGVFLIVDAFLNQWTGAKEADMIEHLRANLRQEHIRSFERGLSRVDIPVDDADSDEVPW